MQRALVTMVTAHREPMRTFSQQVLQMEPQMYRGHSVACPLEDGTLALWRQSACAAYRRALARGVANDRVLMALEVADVEREDARLTGFQVEWVQELTTQPWEHRAFYGRDPDGNVLNVPTAVAEQHHCVRMRVGWGSRSEQPFMAHVRLNVVHSCKLWRLFTCWILQQLSLWDTTEAKTMDALNGCETDLSLGFAVLFCCVKLPIASKTTRCRTRIMWYQNEESLWKISMLRNLDTIHV